MGSVEGLQQRASASAVELRNALARCGETADLFSAGEQSDAAEALESLLRALDTALQPAGASHLGFGAPTLLKNLCGLSVQEVGIRCPARLTGTCMHDLGALRRHAILQLQCVSS